jgi:hypothetical protein
MSPLTAPTCGPSGARDDVGVLEARPRYSPKWCGFVVRPPWLREPLTWNLLPILQIRE